MFSNTAMTVEKLAKHMNRKNSVPQMRPPAMFTKMLGRVTKMSPGPAPVSTPKEKQAGKMMMPAMIATNVSSRVMRTASPGREFSFVMYEPKISMEPMPRDRVKNAWFMAAVATLPRPISEALSILGSR